MIMDSYLDIQLLPDPEFSPPMLMSALFAKLHRGLVQHGRGNVGISFPDLSDTGRTLGNRLRLNGTSDALDALMQIGWLHGMRDHVETSGVSALPANCSHRVVRRVQAKSSPERLRRRLMARQGMDAAAARQAIPDSAAERLHLPYVTLASRSTNQHFRLFIEHLPVQDTPVAGTFTSYGLSTTATVPWF